MPLLEQIEQRSKDISTDRYSMSVGELLSMYRDDELRLHPEYQRLFRWSVEQKSKLIESILLGIPLPSIFVSQRADGKWEIVDGLQRLSTLFELTGELRTKAGEKRPALVLSRTKYLPDLDGRSWAPDDPERALPDEAKLRIKRARLDVNIVLASSDASAKFELFQRLNTGGSEATDQEVRNAILNMLKPEFFTWISNLGKNESFRKTIPLTDRALEEQFDLELVTRFVVFRSASDETLRQIGELGEFLTDKIVEMAESETFDRAESERAFTRTFEAFAEVLGEDSFRRYDAARQQATGAMLISLFEALAVGIGTYAGDPAYDISRDVIVRTHRELPAETRFTSTVGSGIRASTRIPNTVGLGRERFRP